MRSVIALTGAGIIAALGFSRLKAREVAWVIVARDANYNVAIDPGDVVQEQVSIWGRLRLAYGVTFRTDHAKPRLYKEKEFDREIVRSLVQCDSLWFQVLSVDMLRHDRVVLRQRDERRDAPWRRVERGTTEEIAARAACHFGLGERIDLSRERRIYAGTVSAEPESRSPSGARRRTDPSGPPSPAR
jgi:hypothetical protein